MRAAVLVAGQLSRRAATAASRERGVAAVYACSRLAGNADGGDAASSGMALDCKVNRLRNVAAAASPAALGSEAAAADAGGWGLSDSRSVDRCLASIACWPSPLFCHCDSDESLCGLTTPCVALCIGEAAGSGLWSLHIASVAGGDPDKDGAG